jgi:hypothetical protein
MTAGSGCVTNFLLYGIDEAGRTVFSQLLPGLDRVGLRALALAQLRNWPGVEVWEGPVCLVRLRRAHAELARATDRSCG